MKAEEGLLFGQITIKKGLIAPQQLQDCLQTQGALAQRGIKRLIGEVMIEKGLLTNAQVSVVLSLQMKMRAHAADLAFGNGAVSGGYITAMQLKECFSLIENVRKNKPGSDLSLAEVMVNKGLLTAAQRGLIEGAAGGHAAKLAPASSGSTADAAYIPGLHAHHALEGATCHYCKSVIRAEHAVQICGGCKGIYHAECWVASGGCSDAKCEEYTGEGGESQTRAVSQMPGNLAAMGMKLGVVLLAVATVVVVVMLMAKSADDCYMEARKIDESISGAKNAEDRTWGVLDYQRATLGVEEFSGKGVGGVERTRKREQQLEWLRKAIEKNPQHLDAWFDMGVVHLEFKKMEEAYKDFKKVVEIDPKNSRAHIMLGTILEQDKDYKGAEEAYKTAMSAEGKVGPAHRALGVLYDDRFGSTREQEAAKTYREFLEVRDDPEILARLGLILVENSITFDEAGVLFGKALRLEPGLEKAKYGRALVSYKQGRISEASSIICELTRAGANPAYNRLYGICLAAEKRYDDAIMELQKAASSFPEDMETQTMLADTLLAVGRTSEAEATLKSLSDMFPQDTKLLFRCALLALVANNLDKAKLMFERVKNADPEFPDVYYYLAKSSISTQNWQEFKPLLDEASRRAPNDPKVLLLEAEFKRARSAFADASKVCRDVLAKNPNFGPAYFELAIIAKTQRNVGDTVENLRNAITAGGCEDAYYELGRLYIDLAKYDKATECLQGYLDKAPLGAHAREVRDMLATATQWQSMMGSDTGDTSTRLARWVEEARGIPPPEIYQTLSVTFAAVAYLGSCIKGIPQKEQAFAQRVETTMGAISTCAVQPSGDPSVDKATRNQYFDYFAPLYMFPAATDASEMLRAIAAGSQPKSAQATASQRVTEDLKKRMTQESSQLGRLKVITRSWVEYLQIVVQNLERAAKEKAKLDAISSQYEVQRTLCANPLHEICNDLYACAQLTGLLIDLTDASGVYRERAVQLLEQMVLSDSEVETCDQQIGVGATALVQLLSIIASERSLVPK